MTLRSFYKALVRRKYIPDENLQQTHLNRCLSTLDLTLLGVGSTLGLGIYILAGQVASVTAGPAVAISFFIAALVSVFAALCYAEFGSRVPKTGSAYIYSYVTVGEFMAFVIGWNLILEYVIGTASVARGYSGYIDSLFHNTIANHLNETLPIRVPSLSDYPDFLAFGITLLLAVMLALGVKESSNFNNLFTSLNIVVVTYAVITGCFKADVHNWKLTPQEIPYGYGEGGFFPYGFHGVMSGAATCFYGYVGFDCIATTGEEVKNPQKAIPIAIISSLLIVFCAYFSVSTVQTLMWPYYDQNQPAPLPYVFDMVGYPVAKWIISIGALAGLSTSLLGGMFPLPRILYAMANDGLIFKFLGKTHEKYKTPVIATILSGLFAGLMAMMFNIKELADMMSIGTLLAYTLVAVSVLILRYRIQEERVPLAPLTPHEYSYGISDSLANIQNSSLDTSSSLATDDPYLIRKLANRNVQNISASTNTMLASTSHFLRRDFLRQIFNSDNVKVQTQLSSSVSMYIITVLCLLLLTLDIALVRLEDHLFHMDVGSMCVIAFITLLVVVVILALALQPSDQRKLSFRVPYVPLIPVLSIFANIYLMFKLPNNTWYRFAIWMVIGFLIYFAYGMWHSTERKVEVRVLGSISEMNSSESETEMKRTEHSPLLQTKDKP